MTRFSWQTVPGHTTEDARNSLIWLAQRNKSRYLLFWDDDVIAPRFCIHHLFTLMEMNPDFSILSGIYATKSYPPVPLVYRELGEGTCWDWEIGEIFQVKLGAMGMSMIRVADLEKIKGVEEYPVNIDNEETLVKRYFHTGKEIDDSGSVSVWTEDVPFARSVEKAGLKWFVDASVHTICKHYDMGSDTLFSVSVKNDKAIKPEPMKEQYRVCNLGCGKVWYNGSQEASPEAYVVRVDLNEEAHPDFRCDVRVLPTEWKETFDEVHANHVLEHIRWEESDETLEEWIRILKPGGLLKLALPDLKTAAQKILKGGSMGPHILGTIYGDQRSKYWNAGQDIGIHLTGFTPEDIGGRLAKLGLENINITSFRNAVMGVEARKPKGKKRAS
jgi:predicted SAM-dependent methyltransferase